eukprot:5987218-Karenia_brevis.AAC.1
MKSSFPGSSSVETTAGSKQDSREWKSCSLWTRRRGQFHVEEENRKQVNVEAQWKRIILNE